MVRYSFILSLVFAVAVGVHGASAQEAEVNSEFTNPGITPDSPLYFFDDLTERARLLLTFNDEVKAKLELSFADERIAEIWAMVEVKNEDSAGKASARYEVLLKQIEDRTLSPEVLARIAEATGKHEAILERVLANAPEAAKPALEAVIERAKARHEARFEELLEQDEKEAGQVAGAILEARILALKEAVDAGVLTEEQATELARKLEDQENFFSGKERIKIEFRNEFAARLSNAFEDILEMEDDDEDSDVDDDVARVSSRLRIKFETRLEQLVASDPALAAEAVATASERIRLRIEQRIETDGATDGLVNATERLERVRERIEIRIEQKIEDDEVEVEVETEDEDGDDELGGALKSLEGAAENRIKTLEQVKEKSSSEGERKEIEKTIKEEEQKREELKQSIKDREDQQKEEEDRKKEEEKQGEDRSSGDDESGDDRGGNSGSDGADD